MVWGASMMTDSQLEELFPKSIDDVTKTSVEDSRVQFSDATNGLIIPRGGFRGAFADMFEVNSGDSGDYDNQIAA